MTKKINFSTIGFGVLFMTALAFSTQAVDAATYIYVTSSGQISSVSANNATEALAMAPNMAAHSGVMLTNGTPIQMPVQNIAQYGQYAYVNTSGTVVFISANSPAEALANATNIATHSGVILINSISDQALVGDTVTVVR
jgi:hypothetical protein